jgi:hypothetical protein
LSRVKPHHLRFPIHLVPREAERLGLPSAGHAEQRTTGRT